MSTETDNRREVDHELTARMKKVRKIVRTLSRLRPSDNYLTIAADCETYTEEDWAAIAQAAEVRFPSTESQEAVIAYLRNLANPLEKARTHP